MDAMNLVIGAVLFVVVMIVLLTNNQKVADLKKSIKTSAVEAPVSISHGFLARNSSGDYVPQNAYYVELVPKPEEVADLGEDSGFVDRLFVKNDFGGGALLEAITNGFCKVIYRPDTRILYKVNSAEQIPASDVFTVNLERNVTTSSTAPMFTEADITKSDGTSRKRTIIGVPAEMSGNTASGV